MKILGYYDASFTPRRVNIPDAWVERVTEALVSSQGVMTKNGLIEDDKIFTRNLLDESDWTDELILLVTPSSTEAIKERKRLTWDDFRDKVREEDWYRKAKTGKRKLS